MITVTFSCKECKTKFSMVGSRVITREAVSFPACDMVFNSKALIELHSIVNSYKNFNTIMNDFKNNPNCKFLDAEININE